MASAASVLARIVTAVDDEKLGAYGVHVLLGDDEAQHRWRSDDRVNLYSVSKGVSALAAGIAVDEGILSLPLLLPFGWGELGGEISQHVVCRRYLSAYMYVGEPPKGGSPT